MVGEILRKRREELGLDLKEVSRITKIRYDYLKAIEGDAFEKLPVDVYVKGYIRQYAKILNIDPETLIDVYIKQVSTPEKKEVPQEEVSQEKRPRIRYLLIPLLSVVAASILFIILSPFTPEEPKRPSPPPESKKEDLLKVKDTHHTLEVFAVDTTWLFINTDGTSSREVLLQPGDSVKWDAKNGFSLKIGNAGGIKLLFDGKEIGSLGRKGQVIRLDLPSSETLK